MDKNQVCLNDFLDGIVYVINYKRSDDMDDQGLSFALNQILQFYNDFIIKDDDFYRKLYDILDNDIELYCLVVSTVYEITKDVNTILTIEDILLTEDVEIYTADKILNNITAVKFTNCDIPNSYKKNREINKKLLEQYEKDYPCKYSYVPYEERNHNRIVIETNTFLGISHAPTRMVINICKWLQRDCGYEVFLLINRTNSNYEDLIQIWNDPFVYNYREDLEGKFCLTYEGTSIKGFQFEWNKNKEHLKNIVLEFLHDWKPLCVYHIGGPSYRHDIYKKVTTLMSMPCNDGYIESEADVLVSYLNSKSQFILESLNYINGTGQIVKDIGPLGGLRKALGKDYKKKDFNISEDKFAACIVGNRLNAELTQDFINMLEEIADENEKIQYVIIGECSNDIFPCTLKARVSYLGYQTELLDVLKVMDLFINPVRKGGGGGSVCSLQMGTPVVTLKGCDVYACVGDDFACDSLGDMKNIILKYINDNAFYTKQVEYAGKWLEKEESRDSSKIFGELIEGIKKDIMGNK